MPRAGEPRVTVRLGAEDHAVLAAAAASAGVALGALVREAAVRYAAELARDASAGRVRLRRRSAAVPVPSPAVSSADVDLSEAIRELEPDVPASELVLGPPRQVVPASGAGRAAAFRVMAARRSDTRSTGGER